MLSLRHRFLLLACIAGVPLTACTADEEPVAPAPADAAIVLPLPPSTTPPAGGGFSTQSQCGPTWDAQPVEQYDGAAGTPPYFVAYHESRVGYLPIIGCSGTLISDDLFLSAGHCGYVAGQSILFDYQVEANGVPRPPRAFTVASVIEQENNATWDYAIIRLEGSPGREYGHAHIAAVDPPVGSRVTIIGHPDGRLKEIHAASVLDYPGGNWFRHRVDTLGGNSGSGVLNDAGQLVGIHTTGGCSPSSPTTGGNSAMRMSQLIPHSPTLSTLTRGKVLWRYGSTPAISLWTVNPAGAQLSAATFNPGGNWIPMSYANNSILWRNTDGRISYWKLSDANVHLTYADHGPFLPWRAINAANGRILWRNSSTNNVTLWTIDAGGLFVSAVDHTIAAGWTPINYANNHILWRHTSGLTTLWRVDDAGNFLSSADFNPGPAWTPLAYENGQILWRHTDGHISVWNLSRDNTFLSYSESFAAAGWTALELSDRRIAWRHSSGLFSLWNVDGNGSFLSDFAHSVGLDWNPISIAGARP